MSADALPECRKTDAVLALHLDGDVGTLGAADDSGFDFVCVDSLHAHLLECATCQQQLQRARRLDAVLAASAGRAVADDASLRALEQRWMRAIEPAPLPVAAPARRQLRSAVRTTIAVAVAGIATFGWLLLPHDPAPVTTTTTATTITATTVSPSEPPSPSEPASPSEPDDEPAELSIAADALRHHTQRERNTPRTIAPSRASMLRSLREQCEDQHEAPADRLVAARELALATRASGANGESACDELMDMLTTLDDRTPAQHVVLAAIWSIVRSEPRFVGNVQRHLARLEARQSASLPSLDDLAKVTVAARLSVRAVDALVVRIVRRHASSGEALAAALRSGLRPSGTATLLLDSWQELAVRGALGDDEYAASAWFAGQPTTTFGELEDELRTCASSPRRVRCLLALGFATNDSVLPTLLDRTRRGPEIEAAAAAFALARLPRTALGPLVDRAAKDDGAFFLRAALTRAGLEGTRDWPTTLMLREPETEALRFGSFRAFAAVAHRFRDRALVASN